MTATLIHFHANMLNSYVGCSQTVCLWWGGGGNTAAAGQPGQSSSEDKTTLIPIGLIASLTEDIESTCDYFPVIYGLISGVNGLLFLSLSFTFYPFHSSALQTPLLLCPLDPKFIHSVSAVLSEESLNRRPLHQDKWNLTDKANMERLVLCVFWF